MISGARRVEDLGRGFSFAEFTIKEMAPTTNRLNYNVPKGRTRTAKYRQWRDMAGWELKLQKVRPIEGR